MIKLESKKNKTALITGSARRLGKAIAVSVAKLGYDIVLHYNNTPSSAVEDTIKRIEKIGVRAFPFKADLRYVEEIKTMFKFIKKEFKKLDVLINNAAIFKHIDFFKINEKLFDDFININLKSVLFCSIEAAKIMPKSKTGKSKIINIASLGGYLNWQGYIPYSVSKAGVIKLTQLSAKRLAPYILVNAIAPGTVIIENDKNENVDTKEVSKYPLKRFANSDDVTSVINYLIEKNEYITGQTFVVDGGRILF
jgi:NAD(P)-dependent dehydrogenase (short-subunit alcohol dehydrogenase family)